MNEIKCLKCGKVIVKTDKDKKSVASLPKICSDCKKLN